MKAKYRVAGGAGVALTVALAGCDLIDKWTTDPAVRACEIATKGVLKSPSSYRRIEYSIAEDRASVDFDVQNPMGALLRSHASCQFRLVRKYKLPQYNGYYEMADVTIDGESIPSIQMNLMWPRLYEAKVLTISPRDTKLNIPVPPDESTLPLSQRRYNPITGE